MKVTSRKISDTRTLRVVGDSGYGYERYGKANYDVYRLDGDQIHYVIGNLPSADDAKYTVEALVRGVPVEKIKEHMPAALRAEIAGGGWGGHRRTYRTKPRCRTCGDLTPNANTLDTAGAYEHAWAHWRERLAAEEGTQDG